MKLSTAIALTACGTLVSHVSAQVSATFQYIVEPINGHATTSANDITPDGRWIVGGLDTNGDLIPDIGYRWDSVNDVFTIIETDSSPNGVTEIKAVSDDGQVLIGDLTGLPGSEFEQEAGIWTESTGWVGLGWLPNAGACPSRSNGFELSADGTIVTGLSWDACNGRGFVWTEATGMLELENLANGRNRSSTMSADGTVLAGFAQGNSRTPAMWNGITLEGELLDPTFAAGGEFHGMRDDGSVILGTWAMGGTTFEAGKVVDGIPSRIAGGSLLPGWPSAAMDIADNETIVGFDYLGTNRRAWIQPLGAGDLQELVGYINSLGADIPPSTSLEVIQAISSDGKKLIGHTRIDGGWIITLEFECPADFTDDGELDFFDISAFLTAFSANDPSADFTGDSAFDFFDISAFITAFTNGCP